MLKTFICMELSLRLNSSVRILWSSSLQTGFMFQAKRDGLTYIFLHHSALVLAFKLKLKPIS